MTWDLAKWFPHGDALASVGLQIALLPLLILVGCAATRQLPRIGPLVFTLLAIGLATLALFFRPFGVIPFDSLTSWNWPGKVYAILVTLLLIRLTPGASFRDLGFRAPEAGSWRPALIGAAVICAADWGLDRALGGGGPHRPTLEALAFQATMPGLQEEPLFRAYLPFLLGGVFLSPEWNVLGAKLRLTDVLAAAWFGLIHGVGVKDGHVIASWTAVLLTGGTGLGLAWLYVRTRSLLASVVTHNVLNVLLIGL